MKLKQLKYVGSTQKDLAKLPEEVQEVIAHALYLAQVGEKHIDSKVLKGFQGASVLEIKVSNKDGTYRAVYTTKFKDMIFVLYVFQKKSKQGIKTPQKDIDLIKSRLAFVQKI